MWPALIGGGASLLGSIFSSETSASNTAANIAAQEQMQQQTEAFNAQQAQINRDWQGTMSSTAYQRAAVDMDKAGLNPMMMFGSGSAASTPGGASAAVGTPNMALSAKTSPFAGLGDIIPKIVSTAGAVKALEKQANEVEISRQEAAQAANETERSSLALPEARRKALEENMKLNLPKGAIETHATADYKYGDYGGSVFKPYMSGISSLNDLVDKAIEKATGQSARVVASKPNPWSSDAPRNFDERYGYWR